MFEVLDPARNGALRSALDAVVADHPALAAARGRVTTPLDLLAALAREAPATLAGDRAAAERTRLLLTAASGWGVPTTAAEAVVGATPPAAAVPGLVSLGAASLVALAAARAGGAPAFPDLVFGLVLAADAAESVSRALDGGIDGDQLAAVLTGLDDPARRPDGVAWSLLDPVTRRRWALVVHLAAVARVDAAGPWDGAWPSVAGVTPRAACPGDEVVVRLGSVPGPLLVAGNVPPSIGAGSAITLLFGAADGVTIAAGGQADGAGGVRALVPDGARSGWVGLVHPARHDAAVDHRAALRLRWESEPTLVDDPVPLDLLGEVPSVPAPPATAEARFDGGIPTVAVRHRPTTARPGEVVEVAWRAWGATSVALEPGGAVAAAGLTTVRVDELGVPDAVELVATSACGVASVSLAPPVRPALGDVVFSQDGPLTAGRSTVVSAPVRPAHAKVRAVLRVPGEKAQVMASDGGAVSGRIPARLAVDGVTGEVDLHHQHGVDTTPFGPLRFPVLAVREVVVVRPAVLAPTFARVSEDEVRAAIADARAAGVAVERRELAWVDDAVLTLPTAVEGAGLASTDALLEQLADLAARHPGLEHAAWVALVPAVGAPFFARSPSEAAGAVVVATPSELGRALAEALPTSQSATARLRLTGVIGGSSVVLDAVRSERRSAGPGAAVETGLVAVAVDAFGRERAIRPVRTTHTRRPARFVALVPVTDDVAAVEIRTADNAPVARVYRPAGSPVVSGVAWGKGGLTFDYAHPQGARPTVFVEVRRSRVWSPLLQLGACATVAEVPLHRVRADRVRVVATDGWNAADDDVAAEPGDGSVVARWGGEHRLWADVPDGAQVTWRFGDSSAEGPVVQLPAGFSGAVHLEATVDGESVSDHREVPGA